MHLLLIDPVTLARFRCALGLVVIYDKYLGWSSICDFFSDAGVAPLMTVPDLTRGLLHGLNDDCRWQQALHGLQLALGGLLLLRCRGAEACSGLLWALYVSERQRVPITATNGDGLLVTALLWSSLMRSDDAPSHCLAALGLRLQVLSMYLVAVAHKCIDYGPGSMQWLRGDAVRQSFLCPLHATPLGTWLGGMPGLCRVLTWTTMLAQTLCPLALMVLPAASRGSLAALLCLGVMHVAMELTMQLSIFPSVCMACLVLFLPAPAGAAAVPRSWRSALAGVLLVIVAMATVESNRDLPRKLCRSAACTMAAPEGWAMRSAEAAAHAMWITTRWEMYVGYAFCTWHVASAQLPPRGTTVDLHRLMHTPYALPGEGPRVTGATPLWQYLHLEMHSLHADAHRLRDRDVAEAARRGRDHGARMVAAHLCRRFAVDNVTLSLLDYAPRVPPGMLPRIPAETLGTHVCEIRKGRHARTGETGAAGERADR